MNKLDFDISKLSEYREDNCLEVKKATKGLPNSIWETYSSFANLEAFGTVANISTKIG